jgi:hypothetical protein
MANGCLGGLIFLNVLPIVDAEETKARINKHVSQCPTPRLDFILAPIQPFHCRPMRRGLARQTRLHSIVLARFIRLAIAATARTTELRITGKHLFNPAGQVLR